MLYEVITQHGREVRHALGEDVPAGAFAGHEDVAPPLVRRLVGGDHERGVGVVLLGARQEADVLRERDVRGEALGVAGQGRELADLQLVTSAPPLEKEDLWVLLSECETMEETKKTQVFPSNQTVHLPVDRITSYNVCYTKLLRTLARLSKMSS